MKSKDKSARCEQTTGPHAPTGPGANDPLVSSLATFIVIGKTGVGKSTFIKSLGGKDLSDGKEPMVNDGIDSCTQKPAMYRTTVDKKEIILVDTPGFDDSGTENLEVLRSIIGILHFFTLQNSLSPIHGIVFLHDIGEVRFSGSQRKTLSILEAMCGDKCMGNVIVGTMGWSPENPAKFKKEGEREQKFLSEHWGGVCMTKRWIYEDENDVPVQIITDLLVKPQIILLAQEEMLIPPHAIENTTVGKSVIPEACLEMEQKLAEREHEFKMEMDKKKAEAEEMTRGYKEQLEQFQGEYADCKATMEHDVEKMRKDYEEKLGLNDEVSREKVDEEMRKRGREYIGILDKFQGSELSPTGLAAAALISYSPLRDFLVPLWLLSSSFELLRDRKRSSQPPPEGKA